MNGEFDFRPEVRQPPEMPVDTAYVQSVDFLRRVYGDDERIVQLAPDVAKELAGSALAIEADMRVSLGGQTPEWHERARLGHTVTKLYIAGIKPEAIAQEFGEHNLSLILANVARRMVNARKALKGRLLWEEVDDKLAEHTQTSSSDTSEHRMMEKPGVPKTSAQATLAGAATAKELSPHEQPGTEIKLAEVPAYWTTPRERAQVEILTISSNDTLEHTDFPRNSLVLDNDEIQIVNALSQQEGAWIGSGQLADLLGLEVPQEPGAPRYIKAMDSIALKMKALTSLHVIMRRGAQSDRKYGQGVIVDSEGETKWRLNPLLLIQDKRQERAGQDATAEQPIDVRQTVKRVQEELWKQGWSYLPDEALGFGEELTEAFEQVFNSGLVVHAPGDVPKSRKRARDALTVTHFHEGSYLNQTDRVTAPDGIVQLEEAESTVIADRKLSNIEIRPKYSRVLTLDHPAIKRFLEILPQLVPPDMQKMHANMGVNFFRTGNREPGESYGKVVEGVHKDEEDFVFIRVAGKLGNGAKTRLHGKAYDLKPSRSKDRLRPRLSQDIPVGGLLIFRDAAFWHDVTPLFPDASGNSERDAVVVTLSYI